MTFRKRVTERGIRRLVAVAVLAGAVTALEAAPEVRVGDLATVLGLRERALVGVGLVTGLSGKGDSSGSALVAETLRSAGASFGLEASVGDIKSKNCAVVLVTASAPAFTRVGERLSVDVASIGDAKGIDDGVLLATVLKDAGGLVSAVAQGRIQLAPGAKTKTAGTVPNGAVVQRDMVSGFSDGGAISLVLRHEDFSTARAVEQAIRQGLEGVKVATKDASVVEVGIPADRADDVAAFVAELEAVRVKPEASDRVVIDAARGVVVIGESVRIGRVAVSYRRMSVLVGMAAVGAQASSPQESFLVDEPASVADLVGLLQSLELKTDDVIGILQAIDRAGALYGTLVIM